ncbi:YHYH domain-containing protein [Marinomonas aquimarina]|nr:YHYH domain-containing protein [Marinomonas aquimarina]
MKKLISLVFVAFFTLSSTAFAHSGGTNSNGCHNNSKTGDYHCH